MIKTISLLQFVLVWCGLATYKHKQVIWRQATCFRFRRSIRTRSCPKFKCCGVTKDDEGFRDWKRSPYFNCSNTNRSIYRCAVPKSCCIFEEGDRVNIMCGFQMTDKPLTEVRDYIYTRGCISGFGEWLGKYNDFIIISCLCIIIMQFLAVLSAKVMVLRIRKQRSRWRPLRSNCSSTADTMTRT